MAGYVLSSRPPSKGPSVTVYGAVVYSVDQSSIIWLPLFTRLVRMFGAEWTKPTKRKAIGDGFMVRSTDLRNQMDCFIGSVRALCVELM